MRHLNILCAGLSVAAWLVATSTVSLAQQEGGESKAPWSPVCAKDSEGRVAGCRLVHRVIPENGNRSQRLLTIQVHRQIDEDSYIRLQLPTDLDLQSGVSFAVLEEETNFTKLAYRSSIGTCNDAGCFARLPLDNELLAAMKASKTVLVGFVNSELEKIKVHVSLSEFAEAYESLDQSLR